MSIPRETIRALVATGTPVEFVRLGTVTAGHLEVDEDIVQQKLDDRYDESRFTALGQSLRQAYVGDVVDDALVQLQEIKQVHVGPDRRVRLNNAEGTFRQFCGGLELFDASQLYPCSIMATYHGALENKVRKQMQVLGYRLPRMVNPTNAEQEAALMACKDAAVQAEDAISLSKEVIATTQT